MAQIFGEAGTGLGGEDGRGHTEAQGGDGKEHQLDGLGDDHLHVLRYNAVVIQIGHDQGDQHLHGDLANHAQGAEQGGPFVLPDTPGKTFDHWLGSSLGLD